MHLYEQGYLEDALDQAIADRGRWKWGRVLEGTEQRLFDHAVIDEWSVPVTKADSAQAKKHCRCLCGEEKGFAAPQAPLSSRYRICVDP